jgi:hypothetical protein
MARIRRAVRGLGYPVIVATACGMLGGAPRPVKMTCGSCHREEAQSQPGTEMGIGIELPEAQEPLKSHPQLSAEANGYTYAVERRGGQSTYTVKDGSGSLTLPIRYAFGVRNLTFVLEYQGHYYESLMTYYEQIQGLAVTMGDERLHPHNLVEAMGRENDEHAMVACFNCHSTGGVSQGKLTLESLEPGVKCEHCHAGAEAHLRGLEAGKPAPVPKKLGDMAAEDMSNFCGQCHRTWESIVGERLFGPRNVRFQPYRLANSKCFLGNDPRIRCTACHNPHEKLVRDDSRYDAACRACHAQGQPVAAAPAKTCPVADKNCVSCHMPKVQAPGSESTFTDHYIRVAHTGEQYPD